MTGSVARDARLDLIRGYAMLAIAINHVGIVLEPLGFSQQNVPTLTSLGYSSSASLFFALSGYMVGLVYLRRPGAARAIWKRAGLIYAVNAAAFLAGLLIALWQPLSVHNAIEYDAIMQAPLKGAMLFSTMLQQPALLDVLHMYVVLMLLTPLVALLMTRRPALALLLSAGIYTATQFFPSFAPPSAVLAGDGTWTLAGQWNMNLLSWQMLFFGSMYAGKFVFLERVFAWLEAFAYRRWTIIALFALVALIHTGEKFGYWSTPPLVEKRTLAPLRLLHFALTILLLSSMIVWLKPYLAHPIARVVALVGRQTLYGFAASIPATYLGVSYWEASGRTYLAYLIACLSVVAVVIFVARWIEVARSRKADPVSRTLAGVA